MKAWELTRCEKAMHTRLQKEQPMHWHDLIGCDVQTLNRLVTKGIAKRLYSVGFHKNTKGTSYKRSNSYWILK